MTSLMSGWRISATGTIVRIERQNVDKSGRKPKYFYYYTLAWDHAAVVPEGVALPSEIVLKGKDLELARIIDPLPQVGDRVEVEGRTHSPSLTEFGLDRVKRV